MKNTLYISFSVSACVLNLAPCSSNIISSSDMYADKEKKLNVVLILTDDQGYGDLACNGNVNMVTPNIDSLHDRSIRLTDFHSGTTSAPTRSGLLTGHYNNTTGVWHTILGRSILDREEVLMPEIFAESGYKTGLFGKWHLGDNYPYRPFERGFQETLYHGGGGIGQTPDYWNNMYFDDVYLRNGVPEQQVGYCTDVWFNEAISFIENHKDSPFFCMITPNAPHLPHIVSEEYAAPFRDKDNIPDPCFYGMIKNLDDNVGRLMDKMEALDLLKNTIFIFMTDNGSAGGVVVDKQGFVTKGYNAGMRGKKGSPYEGGHRVPFFISVPELGIGEFDELTNYVDILPTLIDICNLKVDQDLKFDGISLKLLFEGKKYPSRTFCVDTQRGEKLSKYKGYCVLSDKWRLINGKELYDISKDPGQKNNLADNYPKVVKKLKDEYEKWWKKNTFREDDYQYIVVNPKEDNLLTIHDAHSEDKKLPAYNQIGIRNGVLTNGEWMIEIEEEGFYQFELMRWPPESLLPLLSSSPLGRSVPNAKCEPVGKVLDIVGAKLIIDDYELTSKINKEFNGYGIKFNVKLNKGKYKLNADFILKSGESYAAYYVLINKCKV